MTGVAKHCVITGAADGIGRELALAFARDGYAITGIDRDAVRGQLLLRDVRTAGGSATMLQADLANSDDMARLVDVLGTIPLVDVVIHNAGTSAVGAFARSRITEQRAVIDVNLLAPMLLTNSLIGRQRFANGATLVFISSLSHFVGYPGAAVYAASKDGLHAYARSIATCTGNVRVLTVYPGPTRTMHARRYSPDNASEERRMPPEQLAAAILRAVQRRKRTLIPGAANRMFALLGVSARGLTNTIMRRTLFEKLRK